MVNTITRKENKSILFGNTREMVLMLSGVFVVIVGLTIFQDFLEQKREDKPSYFKKSLFLKTFCFLFIPFLSFLYKKLKMKLLNNFEKNFINIVLQIYQEFLEAKRRGYTFYFNESLLFKTIWFLFIPILTLLYKKLKDEVLNTYGKTLLYIVLPIAGHLCLLPLISKILSILFYD